MKKNKKLLLGTVISIIVLATPVFAKNFNYTGMKEKVTKVKELKDSNNKSRTLAIINGQYKITENDVEIGLMRRNYSLSKDEMLQYLVDDALQIIEAKRIGISFSDSQVKEFIQNQRVQIEKINDEKVNEEIKNIMETYKVSYDDYWNKLAYKDYKDFMIKSEFRKRIYDNAIKKVEDEEKKQKDEIKDKYNLKIKSANELKKNPNRTIELNKIEDERKKMEFQIESSYNNKKLQVFNKTMNSEMVELKNKYNVQYTNID
ncbi:hypothetical protein [Clostridium sp. ZS2-4]|uniref:hypothetical protein n=1 Tax=Clostridium sp. ZS2-4 TaxID=2987703 RepID=UPI00227A8661|nr:hypothetical protein [Clostridium sp. ZS2-4]MCY6355307.1 hypothetical protein [Clostridium sp. ZS2-4]